MIKRDETNAPDHPQMSEAFCCGGDKSKEVRRGHPGGDGEDCEHDALRIGVIEHDAACV